MTEADLGYRAPQPPQPRETLAHVIELCEEHDPAEIARIVHGLAAFFGVELAEYRFVGEGK